MQYDFARGAKSRLYTLTAAACNFSSIVPRASADLVGNILALKYLLRLRMGVWGLEILEGLYKGYLDRATSVRFPTAALIPKVVALAGAVPLVLLQRPVPTLLMEVSAVAAHDFLLILFCKGAIAAIAVPAMTVALTVVPVVVDADVVVAGQMLLALQLGFHCSVEVQGVAGGCGRRLRLQ